MNINDAYGNQVDNGDVFESVAKVAVVKVHLKLSVLGIANDEHNGHGPEGERARPYEQRWSERMPR